MALGLYRHDFLVAVGCGLLLSGFVAPCAFSAQSPKRPNVLFICTDYQAGVDGPSLGSPFLDMPALDRLCKEGMVFTRHYTPLSPLSDLLSDALKDATPKANS
jgi:hypothetical protein